MSYLEGFRFKVYRLRDESENSEFLLFCDETMRYNLYSYKRLVTIIYDELKAKKIDIIEFIKKIIKIDDLKESKYLEWFEKYAIKDAVELIDSIGYKPTDELVYFENDKYFFNTYRKSKLLDITEPEIKEFPLIEALIKNLVNNVEDEYDYLIKWIAWQIQNPLQRIPTSIILQGEHGTGKTKFCELVLKPIFENNFCEIGQADINKEYNDYILGKQLIVANEVIHNDNKYLVPDKLKNYVTDEYLSINRKYKNTLYARNYSQWIFVTNNQVPLKIELGDRRYNVFTSKKLINGRDLISQLIKNHETEIKAFIWHLKTIDVNYNEVDTPIENNNKKDLIRASFNSVQEFYHYVFDDLGGLDKFYDAHNIKIDIFSSVEFGNYILTNEIYLAYRYFCDKEGLNNVSKNYFSRVLKNYGFKIAVIWHDYKSQRVYIIEK